MKILVCIKQVPDMESKFTIDGTWYDTSDLAWRMNEYDEYGVEQAVQVKEQVGEGDLTVLCIGPDRVKETMKKALAMGCDRGVHLVDDKAAERDPQEIASMIAKFAGDGGFDLIFCGMQSQDREFLAYRPSSISNTTMVTLPSNVSLRVGSRHLFPLLHRHCLPVSSASTPHVTRRCPIS